MHPGRGGLPVGGLSLRIGRRWGRCLGRAGWWLALLLPLLLPVPGLAQTATPPRTLTVGMLAYIDKAELTARWAPTLRALEADLPGLRLQFQPLDYDELSQAIARQQVDFVFTNPEHHVVQHNLFGIHPVATVRARIEGRVVDRFGSVIFARTHTGIQDLAQAKGRSVAAVGLYSLGGFLLADDALRNAGVDLRGGDARVLHFTGTPHTLVVEQVMAGHFEVGIVRTGVIDDMVARGLLKWQDIRVLGERPDTAFVQRLSTDLAPEWPWAAMPHLDDALVQRFAAALHRLPGDDATALQGRHAGFTAPANYAPVEDLMRRLRTYPNDPHAGVFEQTRLLWLNHQAELALVLGGLLLTGLAVSGYLWRTNRHLRRVTGLYEQARQQLQMTSAAFDSQVGLIITDTHTRVLRANQAFSRILGFDEAQLQGQSTALLRGLGLPSHAMAGVWQQLQQARHWRGELLCKHRDGHDVPCMVTITALQEASAEFEGYVGSFVDMSQHHQDQLAIRQLAFFDALTGLPNRRQFLDDLRSALMQTAAQQCCGALIFLDLDHFKLLNDSHGHALGDELLKTISARLLQVVGHKASVARLGGDEFVVLQAPLDGPPELALAQALALAQQLREAILLPCQLRIEGLSEGGHQGISHCSSGSLGVAVFDAHDSEVTEVMRRADIAMYQAKHAGRNTIRHFDPEVNRLLNDRAAMAADLSLALQDGQLSLHYQLQVDRHGRSTGAECLMRWQHPVRGMVSPASFIPLAEESGAIIALGAWVVESACHTLAHWATLPQTEHLELAVNVSPRQFNEPGFASRLAQTLATTGARPEKLVLEITEGILLDNADDVAQTMLRVCAMGVSFAVDDFGTGYSSLSYLQRLPLRQLKIDHAFIRDLDINRNSEAIVRAVIGLGSSLGLTVVAEGVETDSQSQLLAAMGCGLQQGYFHGRPMPLAQLEARLTGSAGQGGPLAGAQASATPLT